MTEQEYELLPTEVKSIVDSWDDNKDLYGECARIKAELETIGWTCDYGLDGEICDVVKLGITIDDFDDVVTDTDGRKWSQLCCGHAEQMTEEGISDGVITSGGSGICGVSGCDVESGHYIDF